MIAVGLGFKWFIFIVMALLAIGSSLMMVTRRNPIHSALWLVVTFFSIATHYVLLNATFIAVAQVMVYAGAIMMLTLFIIMLIHLEWGTQVQVKRSFIKFIGGLITITLLLQILFGIRFFTNFWKIPAEVLASGDSLELVITFRTGEPKTVRTTAAALAMENTDIPLP